jgi:hypothetical protein
MKILNKYVCCVDIKKQQTFYSLYLNDTINRIQSFGPSSLISYEALCLKRRILLSRLAKPARQFRHSCYANLNRLLSLFLSEIDCFRDAIFEHRNICTEEHLDDSDLGCILLCV